MSGLVIVGVDPGPVPGVATLYYDSHGKLRQATVLQCDPQSLINLVQGQLKLSWDAAIGLRRLLAVERFVIGARASRVSSPAAAARVRDQVGALTHMATEFDLSISVRSASEVKPWATEKRLVNAGFNLPKGMPHAADAARHCLFAAVKDGGVPDPLSSKG